MMGLTVGDHVQKNQVGLANLSDLKCITHGSGSRIDYKNRREEVEIGALSLFGNTVDVV